MSRNVEMREVENITAVCECMRIVVQTLLDDSAAAVVLPVAGAGSTTVQVRVSASDVSKVIGKTGRTARSLRVILGAARVKCRQRFELDIIDAAS
jgi:uncharacterized protein